MNDRRRELYERIRKSSKQEFILEEMMRLGFWPRNQGTPQDPKDEIQLEAQLTSQLRQLRQKQSNLHNMARLRREAFKARLAESRRKQEENKQRRELERQERARQWRLFKAQHIIYLGPEVSAGLNHRESDTEQLKKAGLPILTDAQSIAKAIGITVNELRFLSFARKVSTTSHYVRFEIPKKRGGTRLISAPMPRLKSAQHWILRNILDHIPVHEAAHGFRHERSILSNAQPHVGAKLVINMDLQDFFPSIHYRRVRGIFQKMGYAEATSTMLALLCTEPKIVEAELDNTTYYVARSKRFLPQGAPTSPALTNILCRKLDRRLDGMAKSLGFTYTRYADDLTFSTNDATQDMGKMLRAIKFIVAEEGLTIHPEKTRILRDGMQKEVTGIVVNEKPNVDRKTVKRFRALLFQIERDGIDGKSWGQSPDLLASIDGYANFVAMVNPEKGKPIQQRVRAILAKHNYQRATYNPAEPAKQTPPKPEDKKKKDKWWKMW